MNEEANGQRRQYSRLRMGLLDVRQQGRGQVTTSGVTAQEDLGRLIGIFCDFLFKVPYLKMPSVICISTVLLGALPPNSLATTANVV